MKIEYQDKQRLEKLKENSKELKELVADISERVRFLEGFYINSLEYINNEKLLNEEKYYFKEKEKSAQNYYRQ